MELVDLLTLTKTTFDPSDAPIGSIWWRSDLGQLRIRATTTTATSAAAGSTHPYVRPAAWHNLPTHGHAASVTATAGQCYALPFSLGVAATVTGVAVNVVSAAAGQVRVGIQAADQQSGLPTSLVADFGVRPTDAPGVKTWDALSVPLPSGVLYYAVVAYDGVTVTFSGRESCDPIVSAGDAPTFGVDHNCYTQVGVIGSLPPSFGTPAGTGTAPCVSMRLS